MRFNTLTTSAAAILACLVRHTSSQGTTYTGCHMHGSVSYCFDSNGIESPMTTLMTASATSTRPASVSATTTASTGQTTAVTSCHLHATNIYCIDGSGAEVSVSVTGTPTGPMPAQYTDCHAHGSSKYCVDPAGNDVAVLAAAGSSDHDTGSHTGEMDCHFHAGVEHCAPVGQSESGGSSASCDAPPNRDYNIGLRVGSLFIILVTSGIAVFLPLFLHRLPSTRVNATGFTMIKQFGTGIIISTAFVHLYTHASLMFNSDCLTGVDYEATTSAIVMAGILVAFLIEFVGYRVVLARDRKNSTRQIGSTGDEEGSQVVAADVQVVDGKTTSSTSLQNIAHSHSPANFDPNTVLAVGVMEAGILFHSVLIGLTLVVAPDGSANTSGYYRTLLAVIVFHQFFEGLALGARISLLPTSVLRFGIWSKLMMAAAFALVTPLGMAIGIGVLNQFNGNDQSTILTIGVLDALSAGVLLWVGVVDMWARDWAVAGGEMVEAGLMKVVIGLLSLIAGLVLMSVLGKWA